MKESIEQSEASREARLLRLERWMRVTVIGWIATLALLVVVLWMNHRTPDILRAHRLSIVDDAGKERIVLAAPPLPAESERRKRKAQPQGDDSVGDSGERVAFTEIDGAGDLTNEIHCARS